MRVVHVVSAMPTGGAERLVVEMITRAPVGVEPALVCLGEEGPLHVPLRAAGATIHNLGKPRGLHPRTVLSLAQALRALQPDLVHSHLLPADMYTAAALRLTRPPRPPWVATVHSVRPWRGWGQAALARIGYRTARALVAVSPEVAQVLQRARLRGPTLHCIECGVPCAARPLTSRAVARRRAELGLIGARPLVGSIGRLSPEKGHHDLLTACGQLAPHLPNLHLVLVGDGPAREALHRQAARILPGRCTFLGNRPEARELLPLFDIFCLPSHYEGLPLALLEAMAAGRAVVATAVGGVPGAVSDGVHGLLVPPADPPALAGAIARLAGSPELAARLGRQARRRVRACYDVDHMNARYAELYTRLLDKGEAGV